MLAMLRIASTAKTKGDGKDGRKREEERLNKHTMDNLETKVNKAIKLLQMFEKSVIGGGEIELSYSGGKDSDVILKLAQMSGIKFRAIYKNTTIDPPQTIAHCKENGVEIVHPKRSFLKIVEAKGIPSRLARFCCSELKEYKILDNAIQGIRKSESNARNERYKSEDPIICRNYNKDDHVNVCLPILDWTDEDVREFIERTTLSVTHYTMTRMECSA